MFCATCFQTAEEGSKYCSGCRQVREGLEPGAEAVAWSVLPEAPAESWALNAKCDGQPSKDPSPLAASAWDEGTVWTPPPPSEDGLLESLPRAQAASPANDEVIGNPFGEPPTDAIFPFSSEPQKAAQRPEPALEEVKADLGNAVAASGPVDDHLGEATLISIQPFRRRGNRQITAMLLVGFLLLSVTAVGQVFRDPGEGTTVATIEATQSETPTFPVGDDSAETAQIFLNSAKASMEGKDYELAASQLKKAIQELETAGAPEPEIDVAKLLLARAAFAEGQLERAQDLCAQLGQGSVQGEAGELLVRIHKELRKEAQSMLASAREDLQSGRLTPALQKARSAKALFTRYGGSTEQLRAAKVLIARADRASAALGLERPRRTVPLVAAQTQVRRIQRQPGKPIAYPRRPAAPPTAARAEEPVTRTSVVSPDSLPMAQAMRRQQRPPSPSQTGSPSSPSNPSNPEGQAEPETGPVQPRAASGPARTSTNPSSSSRRSRAGSNDVLPSYSSQDGGSAY